MSDATIDPAILDELNETMGADFAAELVQTFFDEAPGMFAELSKTGQSGDADGFRRAAHSIKSNAQTFGATGLAEAARDLELADMPADPAAAVADLLALYEASAAGLRDRLNA